MPTAGHVGPPCCVLAFLLASGLLAWPVGSLAEAQPHPYGKTADLEARLQALQENAVADEWVEVGAGATLREGDRGERVARLRRRLAASGDLAEENARGDRFDAETTRAVEHFQRRHGLEVDGAVGSETLAALDEPLPDLVAEIERNLEARRAFDAKASSRYVLVNVPDFRLVWVRRGETPLVMRVAVGKEGWATPPIDDRIDRLELNPSWHLPSEIVAKELAAKVKADPEYLAKKDLVVLDGWGEDAKPVDPASVDWSGLDPEENRIHVVQKPGPDNPLGRIKFLFPNREEIYLHDTPDRAIFDRRERDVSHGCIRLEAPLDLAARLVAGMDGWDRDRLERAIENGESSTVELREPVPVHLVYWTAWVDAEGVLQIRKDLYGDEVDPTSTPL